MIIFGGDNFKSKYFFLESPPPPPPAQWPFFRAGAVVAMYFALPKQTPWYRACMNIIVFLQIWSWLENEVIKVETDDKITYQKLLQMKFCATCM